MKTKFTILGSGSSSGVPVLGRGWGACDPLNPKNRRTRSSILVERGNTRVLIDTSPDLREQGMKAGLERIDAVFYTHAHADHMHGIDDLRWLNASMNREIPIYARAHDIETIKSRFSYVFEPLAPGAEVFYKPVLKPILIDGVFSIGDLQGIEPIRQDHGFGETVGFRFGNAAYSTDVLRFPDGELDKLRDLDLWIVGCLWVGRPHATHAHWERIREWVDEIKPKRVVVTHMNHMTDFDEINQLTPDNVFPAYDGMCVES